MKALFQDQDIVAAGERLRAERPGGLVSAWDVLKALGGRGKLERVERIWTARLAEAAEVAEVPAVVETPLPPRLAEARDADLDRVASSLEAVRVVASSLYATTWTIADEIAQGRVAAERKTFSDQRDEYERQEALARELQTDAEGREEALEIRVDSLDGELARTRTVTTQLTERLAAAEAEAARSVERSGIEIARLTGALYAAEAATAVARQEAAGAAATAAAAQAEAERDRTEIDTLRRSLDVARAEKAELSTRLATAEARTAAATDDLERERQTAIAVASAARAEADRAREEMAVLRHDLDAARAAKAGVDASLAAAEARAEVVADELGREREARAAAVADASDTAVRLARSEELTGSLKAANEALRGEVVEFGKVPRAA